jgi:hypothetical protein
VLKCCRVCSHSIFNICFLVPSGVGNLLSLDYKHTVRVAVITVLLLGLLYLLPGISDAAPPKESDNANFSTVIMSTSALARATTSTTPKALVIWAHGLGDSGRSWTFFRREIPHYDWRCPTAPTRSVSVAYGDRMPAWYASCNPLDVLSQRVKGDTLQV